MISGDLKIWRSGDLEILKSGDLEFWSSGELESHLSLPKDNGHGRVTSPFYIKGKGNGDGMANTPFYIKEESDEIDKPHSM